MQNFKCTTMDAWLRTYTTIVFACSRSHFVYSRHSIHQIGHCIEWNKKKRFIFSCIFNPKNLHQFHVVDENSSSCVCLRFIHICELQECIPFVIYKIYIKFMECTTSFRVIIHAYTEHKPCEMYKYIVHHLVCRSVILTLFHLLDLVCI